MLRDKLQGNVAPYFLALKWGLNHYGQHNRSLSHFQQHRETEKINTPHPNLIQ